jgi:hypothetical protein
MKNIAWDIYITQEKAHGTYKISLEIPLLPQKQPMGHVKYPLGYFLYSKKPMGHIEYPLEYLSCPRNSPWDIKYIPWNIYFVPTKGNNLYSLIDIFCPNSYCNVFCRQIGLTFTEFQVSICCSESLNN